MDLVNQTVNRMVNKQILDLLGKNDCITECYYDEDQDMVCVWTCDSPEDQYDHSSMGKGVEELMAKHNLELDWNDCPGYYNEGIIRKS